MKAFKSLLRNLLVVGTAVSSLSTCSSAFTAPSTRWGSLPKSRAVPSTRLAMDPAGITESISNAWSSYNDALEADPLLVKSVTASVILGAADLTGQALEGVTQDTDKGVDWARAARFAIFGLVLQAPWNHFYYLMLDGALPPTPDPFTPTTGIKVFIDQFVQAPVFTVLIFAFLGTLEGKNLTQVKKQLDDDYVDTMFANWKLWLPATLVNIAFCPPIFRVLFLNVVFFFWSIFLSLKLNKDDEAVASS